MPDASPARLNPDQALDDMLAAMFRRLQSEPAPPVLMALIDRLEAAHWVGGETRAID